MDVMDERFEGMALPFDMRQAAGEKQFQKSRQFRIRVFLLQVVQPRQSRSEDGRRFEVRKARSILLVISVDNVLQRRWQRREVLNLEQPFFAEC